MWFGVWEQLNKTQMIEIKLNRERRGAVSFLRAVIRIDDYHKGVESALMTPGVDSNFIMEFMQECFCKEVNLNIWSYLWEKEHGRALPDFYEKDECGGVHVRGDFESVAGDYKSFIDFQSSNKLEIVLATTEDMPIVANEDGLSLLKR